MFDPAKYQALMPEQSILVRQVAKYTEAYFKDPRFDASHDFNHVLRVTALAIKIFEKEQAMAVSSGGASYDVQTVILGALLHDIEDRKYREVQSQTVPLVQAELVRMGLEETQAKRIQALVDGVSYSSEKKNPQRVRDLLVTIPELAIVQDADRLDAIGAVGVGRCFAYGAARTSRSLGDTMKHFDDKLLKLEGLMKTQAGRELAAKYTARLEQFKSWWHEEMAFADSLP